MNRRRGLSLIEVLLSFTVLTVAVLALVGLLPVASANQANSDLQNKGLFLAQEYVDQILQDNSKITPLTATTVDPETGATFTISKSQTNPAPGNPNCTLFSVDVSWLERGRVRHVTLRSMFTN